MEFAAFTGHPHFAAPQRVGAPMVEKETEQRFHALSGDILALHSLTGNGPLVSRLEEEIAVRHGVAHAIAVANATLAQMLLLKAMGLESGEILVSANAAVAVPHACTWQGLKPVFCDIDPLTLNMAPDEVERKLTGDTVAVIPTHAFGVLADMPAFGQLCRKLGLLLFADASQAFDCDAGGIPPGGHGVPEFVSLHAAEYFSAVEGGVILTDDAALARELRHLRNLGLDGSGQPCRPGLNAVMSEMHAAFGLASLPALDRRRQSLRAVRAVYRDGLSDLPGVAIHPVDAAGRNNYRYFVLRFDDAFGVPRDAVAEILRRENILAQAYFSPGCHHALPYREFGEDVLPRVEGELPRLLCLPTSFIGLDPLEAARDIVAILRGVREHSAELLAWWRGD